jgi:hypothetical protein
MPAKQRKVIVYDDDALDRLLDRRELERKAAASARGAGHRGAPGMEGGAEQCGGGGAEAEEEEQLEEEDGLFAAFKVCCEFLTLIVRISVSSQVCGLVFGAEREDQLWVQLRGGYRSLSRWLIPFEVRLCRSHGRLAPGSMRLCRATRHVKGLQAPHS